ncbi:hypothetical protein EXA18_00600 [Vibrio cincinnatiensis]|uniref:hypothetical protein n=1 Tax=Vibrio cincinnatiensis TaxID=675 RepID=UPI001EDD1BDA|nr:hypothetical protein [Vibrio cincinnatiensis]MCG3741982.1 hypothetical protein [Vibrio cincinnatiensis]
MNNTQIITTSRQQFFKAIKEEFHIRLDGDNKMSLYGDCWSAQVYCYEAPHHDVTFTQWTDKTHCVGNTFRFYTANKKLTAAITRELKRIEDDSESIPF